jgi:hypothetical protein
MGVEDLLGFGPPSDLASVPSSSWRQAGRRTGRTAQVLGVELGARVSGEAGHS